MKHSTVFWTVVIVCVCIFPAAGKEKPEATAQYEKSLEKLKTGDLDVDFKAFRFNWQIGKYSQIFGLMRMVQF